MLFGSTLSRSLRVKNKNTKQQKNQVQTQKHFLVYELNNNLTFMADGRCGRI